MKIIDTEIKESSKQDATKDDVPRCPYCDSDNVYGMSRVVGYYSIIDNWNQSKKAELKQRQKGKYWSDELK